jgi:hypothetical protein
MEEVEILQQQQLLEDRRKIEEEKRKSKIKKTLKVANISQDVGVDKITNLLRIIFILSIFADLLGMIPVIGSVFGIFFAVLFFVLYYLNDLGGETKGSTKKIRRQRVTRWIFKTFFLSAEGIPVLGILPLFTVTALVEMALSQKTVKSLVNKMSKVTNKMK